MGYSIKSYAVGLTGNTFLQGGNGYSNVTFPIAFSRVFTPLITAMNDEKTQNNLHINSYWNTGFNCYNNDYAILWVAFGV